MNRRCILLNLSGPSGVGKDTMLDVLLQRHGDRVQRVSTVTTRASSREADPSYTTVSHDDLDRIASSGRWVVTSQLGGTTRYGTSLDEVEAIAAAGRVAVHNIHASQQGAGRLRASLGVRLYSIGVLACSGDLDEQIRVLRNRLVRRGRDDPKTIDARLAQQADTIEYIFSNPLVDSPNGPMPVFDEILVNDDLALTGNRLQAIWLSRVDPGSAHVDGSG